MQLRAKLVPTIVSSSNCSRVQARELAQTTNLLVAVGADWPTRVPLSARPPFSDLDVALIQDDDQPSPLSFALDDCAPFNRNSINRRARSVVVRTEPRTRRDFACHPQ